MAKSIQTIALRAEMFESIKNGTKKATLRNGKRDYELGKTIMYCDIYNIAEFINVKKVEYKKLSDITDLDAQQEGYDKRSELIDVMKKIYEEITEESIVTQVFFTYVPRQI